MDEFLSLQNRFWSKVEVGDDDECWNWIARCSWNGYGHFDVGKKTIRAHRFSYELHKNRKITPGLCVMHCCDNPLCVNPRHLKEGTAFENARDKVSKQRQSSKLTEKQVIEIRNKNEKKHAELALEYGITTSQIAKIISRKCWTHI